MIPLPMPLFNFFQRFPLVTYAPLRPPENLTSAPSLPTLWIRPPPPTSWTRSPSPPDLLSADVECLKWQAYLSLQNSRSDVKVAVSWDIPPEGALDGRLPNLHLPSGKLLPAPLIPSFVEEQANQSSPDDLEGYINVDARNESRAWVSLLEGVVHATLIAFKAHSTFDVFSSDRSQRPGRQLAAILPAPTPMPYFAYPLAIHFALPWSDSPTKEYKDNLFTQYVSAITALSDRLGTDRWFLGSEDPTPLDALVFAYLHCILCSSTDLETEDVRVEVTKRVNLVAWEWRVRGLVRAGFVATDAPHT
ncbi:hypothetical protein FISHEDRAFT_53005 [Fistulina hepatica ATCC 64428]|nr:hypothetical protein FISHEDRAFT_53005 [Fistulina hepatica ATCC 64428]